MADAPDFTFSTDDTPSRELLMPIYRQILNGNENPPTISLGAVTRDVAESWLRRQHERYSQGVATRSHLIKNMDLTTRVELVGLVGE